MQLIFEAAFAIVIVIVMYCNNSNFFMNSFMIQPPCFHYFVHSLHIVHLSPGFIFVSINDRLSLLQGGQCMEVGWFLPGR